jgi:recombinational DNA repair protein (RecF pathway)
MSVDETVAFLSPQSKLVRFFHRSRDKWKTKCKDAKRENKSLKYRLAVMTASRNRWKAEARGSGETAAAQTASVVEETLK